MARRLIVFLALAAGVFACDEVPLQPDPLTDCAILGVIAPTTLAAGEGRRLSAFLEHCRPMYFPLDPGQVTWQSLDPGVASISGDTLTAVARGAAVIQGTYGDMTQQALVMVDVSLAQPGQGVPARVRVYGCPSMSVSQRGAFGAFAIIRCRLAIVRSIRRGPDRRDGRRRRSSGRRLRSRHGDRHGHISRLVRDTIGTGSLAVSLMLDAIARGRIPVRQVTLLRCSFDFQRVNRVDVTHRKRGHE